MKLFSKIIYNFFTFLLMFLFVACTPKINLDHRIGFGLAEKANANRWANELGAQWYFDWGVQETPVSNQLEYWQTIRVNEHGFSPSREDIVFILKNYPGFTWMIGNEPDNQHQDNTSPEKYAEIYHDLYYLIKKNDRTAKVVIAGVSQPTPSRLAYLDVVLDTYQTRYGEKLPVDWWNIHAYVLREEKDSWGAGLPVGMGNIEGYLYAINDHGDTEIFKENVSNFRKWLKENGYQNIPLVVSEYGILLPEEFGFDQQFIAEYLLEVNEWMIHYSDLEIGYPDDDYRIVQKFAWFSLSDPNYPDSNLANLENDTLTTIGEAFAAFSANFKQGEINKP
jgi:hypothetical protein